MPSLEYICNTLISALYAVIVLLALIYSLPILCIRRFRHRANLFTSNFCLTTALSCLFWLPMTISTLSGCLWDSLGEKWPWLYVLQNIADTAIPYSLVLVSFHRYCSIVYPLKRFFRTRTWMVVCFVGQWVLATLLSIPNNTHPRWVGFFLQSSIVITACMNSSLEITRPVATSVRASQCDDYSSYDLHRDECSDLPLCLCVVRPCSNTLCTRSEQSRNDQPSGHLSPSTHGHHVLYFHLRVGAMVDCLHCRIFHEHI